LREVDEEDDGRNVETTGFLSSQVSFDLDETASPRRKDRDPGSKKSTRGARLDATQLEEISACPGCGSEIPEGEFVETILSFISGSADYLTGDPVRVRSVHMLHQMVSQGKMPDPHSEWSTELVQRIEQHIEHMAEERVRLIQRQDRTTVETGLAVEIEARVRAELEVTIRAELEKEIVGEVAIAIRDQIEAQVESELRAKIRADVEQEMWQQFEEVLRQERARRTDKSE
jgi:hypothetical protein